MVPKLYTINGNYPSTDWAFTLTPENMGMAPIQHQHPLEDLNEIQPELDVKANVSHTHEMVSQLYVDETIPDSHNVVITSTVSDQPMTGVLTIQEKTVKVRYDSAQTGNTQWVNNSNTKSERTLVGLTDSNDYISNNYTIETLTFRGNINA